MLQPNLTHLRQIIRDELALNDDGLQGIGNEQTSGKRLEDSFKYRLYADTKPSLSDMWTDAGLKKPANARYLSVYTRKVYSYPVLSASGKFPIAVSGVAAWVGFEAGGDTPLFICSIYEKDADFYFQVGGPPGDSYIKITALMPSDYNTVGHNYRIALAANQDELYIDGVLRAVVLMGVQGNIPGWENNPPYALWSNKAVNISSVPAFIESGLPQATELNMAFSPYTGFMAEDGIPLPARQYSLYTENTSTKWSGLTTGASLTSHPIPVWGYPAKTLLFQADAAGELRIQVYAGGGWRTIDTKTLVANALYQYNLTAEVPIARCIYNPASSDTIAVAEWCLSGSPEVETETPRTLSHINAELAFLEFDDNFVKPNWDDDNADGVIYSPVATSGAIDTYSDVWSKIFPPSELAGTLEKMARGETASFSTLNATTTLTWQWQIRPKDAVSWIDLHPAVTESPAAITTFERTRQGEKIPAGLTTTPFEIKLRFKTSEANQGQAKVKASSYVKFRLHAT